MAEFSLQALNDEIDDDPMGIGYKMPNDDWKGDQEIADLINDPKNGDIIQRQYLQPQEIIEQIALTDWVAIGAAEQCYIALLPSLSIVSAVQDGTEVRNNLLDIFDTGTDTRDNLVATVQRQGSRAEMLWDENTLISLGQVGHSANL